MGVLIELPKSQISRRIRIKHFKNEDSFPIQNLLKAAQYIYDDHLVVVLTTKGIDKQNIRFKIIFSKKREQIKKY